MGKPALLALADGNLFYGESVGFDGETSGEVVFNTAMTGYQEILTDPSYARQIVTLTYPHIGNTGTNSNDAEAAATHVAGLILRDLPLQASSWRQQMSLPDYLQQHAIVAIADIDTRRLTRILRDKGAQNGCIITGDMVDAGYALERASAFPGLAGMDLAREVATPYPYRWSEGSWQQNGDVYQQPALQTFKVIAYDFGIKRSILRMLAQRGCDIMVVPAQTSAKEVLAMQPDGIFLSNGPGDPEPCNYAIAAIQEFLGVGVPVFGICLGYQLLSLASGAKTVKMKFGHHGANHPVQDLVSRQVMITSQNHGFAVDESSLPDNLRATHKSLFDGSLQGVERTDCQAFGFQGHPEASPGPHDMALLFDRFVDVMQEYKNA